MYLYSNIAQEKAPGECMDRFETSFFLVLIGLCTHVISVVLAVVFFARACVDDRVWAAVDDSLDALLGVHCACSARYARRDRAGYHFWLLDPRACALVSASVRHTVAALYQRACGCSADWNSQVACGFWDCPLPFQYSVMFDPEWNVNEPLEVRNAGKHRRNFLSFLLLALIGLAEASAGASLLGWRRSCCSVVVARSVSVLVCKYRHRRINVRPANSNSWKRVCEILSSSCQPNKHGAFDCAACASSNSIGGSVTFHVMLGVCRCLFAALHYCGQLAQEYPFIPLRSYGLMTFLVGLYQARVAAIMSGTTSREVANLAHFAIACVVLLLRRHQCCPGHISELSGSDAAHVSHGWADALMGFWNFGIAQPEQNAHVFHTLQVVCDCSVPCLVCIAFAGTCVRALRDST
eukprot:INCI6180.2.p1 GENE.INCI6180.2~~INCI6180.2.p1  ORF type:complete len:408 (+),score=49.26 INCI6180.2:473-1696(+)